MKTDLSMLSISELELLEDIIRNKLDECAEQTTSIENSITADEECEAQYIELDIIDEMVGDLYKQLEEIEIELETRII